MRSEKWEKNEEGGGARRVSFFFGKCCRLAKIDGFQVDRGLGNGQNADVDPGYFGRNGVSQAQLTKRRGS